MKNILGFTLVSLFSISIAHAADTTSSNSELQGQTATTIVQPDIKSDDSAKTERLKSYTTIEQSQADVVDDTPPTVSRSPIGFLQGQLRLTPEQVEKTKQIFQKHYSQAKDEFSEILTPEQKERLNYLENQDIKQSISF